MKTTTQIADLESKLKYPVDIQCYEEPSEPWWHGGLALLGLAGFLAVLGMWAIALA